MRDLPSTDQIQIYLAKFKHTATNNKQTATDTVLSRTQIGAINSFAYTVHRNKYNPQDINQMKSSLFQYFPLTKSIRPKSTSHRIMLNTTTIIDLALKAANAAEFNSFSLAYKPIGHQTECVLLSFNKNYPLSRTTIICDSGLVKQLCFVKPNAKIAVLSCPFATTNKDNEAVIAGSLGDGFNVCPVTIRMRDVTGLGISVVKSSATVNHLKMATSTSKPLEEEGPPPAEGVEPEAPGPDRIKIAISNPDEIPCFVAIPKVFPLPIGFTIPTELMTNTLTAPPADTAPTESNLAVLNVWHEAIGYGVKTLNDHSIHHTDTLFVYDTIEKADFKADHLVSNFTTEVTYLTQDDELYHLVQGYAEAERKKASHAFGSHTTAPNSSSTPSVISTGGDHDSVSAATNPRTDGDQTKFLERFSKVFLESSAKSSMTSAERERVAEASDTAAFYKLLFASVTETLQDDGTTRQVLTKAELNPFFETGVLNAVKNSKATSNLQSIVESVAAEMSVSPNRFAAASHLNPRLFDQATTAAIRTGTWGYRHTVLNPPDVKTHYGFHHMAPARTWTAAYKARLEGATKLIQQEHVEEFKSRLITKVTEIYHQGRMGSLADLNETMGNFWAFMHCVVTVNPDAPPLIWKEIEQFDRILRTDTGRDWAEMHRNLKEVLFNVLQEIQSTITGFVAESRKQGYKNAISAGKNISPMIFDSARQQGNEFRRNLQTAVTMMTAGHYKDVPATYSLFQPAAAPTREAPIPRKRDLPTDASTPTQPSRTRNPSNGSFNTDRQSHSGTTNNHGPTRSTTRNPTTQCTVSASGATVCTVIPSPGTQPLPGHTMFKLHSEHTDMRRLPNPGAIFPHPTRSGQYAMMCNRSAYEERTCPSAECPHYHFPMRLATIPADLKSKLKTWVAGEPNVSWSTTVSSWVGVSTPAGN